MFLPRENYDFPVFTSKFDKNQVYQMLKEKCNRFKLKVNPIDNMLNTESFKLNNNQQENIQSSFRNIFDPFVQGKNTNRYT